jgi:serine/threonine-protein kinase
VRLNVDVAVKCLDPLLARQSDDFVKRYHREANIAATVTHENLIRVYDVSESSGLHYLVMEYVAGETGRERVKPKGALRVEEALKIIRAATKGLRAAHGRGIVHRDIKPDNILISAQGEVKLGDLGLCKAPDEAENHACPSFDPAVLAEPRRLR